MLIVTSIPNIRSCMSTAFYPDISYHVLTTVYLHELKTEQVIREYKKQQHGRVNNHHSAKATFNRFGHGFACVG